MIKKYILYLLRWQLSTPLLAICVYYLTQHLGSVWTTIIANLTGGLIFFWIDGLIFGKKDFILSGELWEIKANAKCSDCGADSQKAYRLVKSKNYDKTTDKNPKFRCPKCSRRKYLKIKKDSLHQ